MRIESPRLIHAAGWLATAMLKPWLRSLALRAHWADDTDPEVVKSPRIYAVWHEGIFGALAFGRKTSTTVLISRHRDGELVSQVIQRFGLKVVRGSTTRGGTAATRQLLRDGDGRHILITPDGPRGPRRQLQRGVVYLSSVTTLPIVPTGFAFSRARRFRSWDKLALPLPGSTVDVFTAPPIYVPRGIGPGEMDYWRQCVQQSLDTVTSQGDNFKVDLAAA